MAVRVLVCGKECADLRLVEEGVRRNSASVNKRVMTEHSALTVVGYSDILLDHYLVRHVKVWTAVTTNYSLRTARRRQQLCDGLQ